VLQIPHTSSTSIYSFTYNTIQFFQMNEILHSEIDTSLWMILIALPSEAPFFFLTFHFNTSKTSLLSLAGITWLLFSNYKQNDVINHPLTSFHRGQQKLYLYLYHYFSFWLKKWLPHYHGYDHVTIIYYTDLTPKNDLA